jgi:hypothetical protein
MGARFIVTLFQVDASEFFVHAPTDDTIVREACAVSLSHRPYKDQCTILNLFWDSQPYTTTCGGLGLIKNPHIWRCERERTPTSNQWVRVV